MTIGKAFGGGMPIGGLVTSQKIMSLFTTNPPLGHITTFGGHPMCCAGALAGLEVLENENIISNNDLLFKIISSIDLFLIGIVLLIFGFGVYELFISEIDEAENEKGSKILAISSLDQLKDKIANQFCLRVDFFRMDLSY